MRNTVKKDKAENEIREAKKKTKKISKQIYVYCFRKSFDIYIYGTQKKLQWILYETY